MSTKAKPLNVFPAISHMADKKNMQPDSFQCLHIISILSGGSGGVYGCITLFSLPDGWVGECPEMEAEKQVMTLTKIRNKLNHHSFADPFKTHGVL
jgi:hypothetical protein